MWILSIVALSIVVLLCTVGVYHGDFKDNVFQRIGMGLLVIGGIGRIGWLYQHQMTDPSWTVFHCGVACYAIGTAYKVVILNGREFGWRFITRLDAWRRSKTQPADFDNRPHHHH